MASAQVISKPAVSSRKKKDLEAGKRLLEEFRKKKGVAKKEASTGQPRTDDATPHEKHISENGQALSVYSGNSFTGGHSDIVTGASVLSDHNDKSHVSHYGSESAPHVHVDTQTDNSSSPNLLQKLPKQMGNSHEIPAINYQTGSDFPQQMDYGVGNFGTDKGEGRYADAISSNRPSVSQAYSNRDSLSKLYGSDKDYISGGSFSSTNVSANDIAPKAYGEGYVTNVPHQESDSVHSSMDLQASASDLGHSHVDLKNHLTFGLEERKPSNTMGNLVGFGSEQASEPRSIGFKSDIGGLFNGPPYSAVAEQFPRRSRLSFLDSIVKDSFVSSRSFIDPDNYMNSNFSSSNKVAPSAVDDPSTISSPVEPLPTPANSTPSNDFYSNASKEHHSFEHSLGNKLEFSSQKQNDDFAALEQYIEDLTQEKFSLQRTLESSKVLTESLAAENSSLTESYNQQASFVNQLKAEKEILQDEIKALLVELEAIKGEYSNAQLECNASDERAKLLASEVISLEEKALRLRSNELKLERELENSSAEISSYKKKVSSLDKERRDLLQTIDALQEEKKLLQSKSLRASASEISVDLNNGHVKKDASTSTDDIGLDAEGDSSKHASSNMLTLDSVDNLQLLETSSAGYEDFANSIPPDQVQMIQNINSLITEIMSEKEKLMQALVTEVSTSTKLKELNKELSQKLEVQTQRLELLTSQSMASDNVAIKQSINSHIVLENVTYADEGDEVVERVLGWIMKLFPGGPSKRRTSRL